MWYIIRALGKFGCDSMVAVRGVLEHKFDQTPHELCFLYIYRWPNNNFIPLAILFCDDAFSPSNLFAYYGHSSKHTYYWRRKADCWECTTHKPHSHESKTTSSWLLCFLAMEVGYRTSSILSGASRADIITTSFNTETHITTHTYCIKHKSCLTARWVDLFNV